jgi:putative PIN family toxin of toxin-antitoxin system
MIATFDTSILVRATKRSDGPARRAINAMALNPDHVIALSPFILGEVGKVLSYPRMQALYKLTPDEIHSHVDFLRSIARIVEPQRGLPVVLSDPNDDPILYTAVAAGADILCVRDRHFYDPVVVAFCKGEDIRIMDDLSLLELLSVPQAWR